MAVPSDPRASAAPDRRAGHDRDEELVARLGSGDENALRALHQRYAALVFTVAARIVDTTTAEDVVQDVFVTLWRKHRTFDPSRGSFKSWIVQVARHRALNELRSRKSRGRHDEEPLERLADDSLEPDEMQWLEHRRAAVRKAVDALPAPQRQALSLAFFDELTHEQIASVLRTPVGTTKTRIRLALRRLGPLLLTILSAVVIGLALRRHEERSARNEQALRMVTASDVVTVRLRAAPGVPGDAHGTYRTRPGAHVAVLTTSHLPGIAGSGTYAAWAHRQGRWEYLGAVLIEEDGRSVLVSESIPATIPDEVRVTLERGDDRRAPHGDVVLEGSPSDAAPKK